MRTCKILERYLKNYKVVYEYANLLLVIFLNVKHFINYAGWGKGTVNLNATYYANNFGFQSDLRKVDNVGFH